MLKISLRELVIVFTCIIFSVAGIVAGPPIAWVGCVLYPIFIFGFAINAIFGLAEKRAFAVSFLLPSLAYLYVTVNCSSMEYTEGYGRLPTSIFFSWVMSVTQSVTANAGLDAMRSHYRSLSVLPLGHLSVACLLGYCFGHYGAWIYRNNKKAEESQEMAADFVRERR